MTDKKFRTIDRLFVLSFKNGDDDPTEISFDMYYIPLTEIKGFNALIDNKPFFDQPVKNKQEVYKKLLKIIRNNNYTTGTLWDYSNHQNY